MKEEVSPYEPDLTCPLLTVKPAQFEVCVCACVFHLGSVGVGPSLEVDDAVGVSGALLRVFVHGPLLQLRQRGVGVFSQLHVRVLHGQAGREASVLPHQASTAAPEWETRDGVGRGQEDRHTGRWSHTLPVWEPANGRAYPPSSLSLSQPP